MLELAVVVVVYVTVAAVLLLLSFLPLIVIQCGRGQQQAAATRRSLDNNQCGNRLHSSTKLPPSNPLCSQVVQIALAARGHSDSCVHKTEQVLQSFTHNCKIDRNRISSHTLLSLSLSYLRCRFATPLISQRQQIKPKLLLLLLMQLPGIEKV